MMQLTETRKTSGYDDVNNERTSRERYDFYENRMVRNRCYLK